MASRGRGAGGEAANAAPIGAFAPSFASPPQVQCSMIEIYMEKVRDLLNVSAGNLRVRNNPARGAYVEGATHALVSSSRAGWSSDLARTTRNPPVRTRSGS